MSYLIVRVGYVAKAESPAPPVATLEEAHEQAAALVSASYAEREQKTLAQLRAIDASGGQVPLEDGTFLHIIPAAKAAA